MQLSRASTSQLVYVRGLLLWTIAYTLLVLPLGISPIVHTLLTLIFLMTCVSIWRRSTTEIRFVLGAITAVHLIAYYLACLLDYVFHASIPFLR